METPTAPEIDLSERLKVPGPLLLRGRNPRKEFDPAYMAWLKSSIKAQGILQDPLVRRLPDGSLELVAGECRIINWIELYGEEPLFVKVKEMTDAEARAASLTENVIRKAMSPVEEAEAAALTLGDCNNDRDDAARYLGWKRDMLDNRLALMYAIEPVREALKAKKIALGHAELLATCRKEAQENALGLLLGQEKIMPITEFKAFLERAALVLDTAIFDKTQCAGCHQNSSNQSALFAEAISGGKCTNKACFDGKTEAELDARKLRLSEDYQVVRIVRPGENLTVVRLTADGPKGVGAEQAMACRTCANFGAVVSAVPDKMGMEYRDMCMDVTCNVRKVAAFHKPAPAAEPEKASSTGKGKSGKAAGASKPSKPASASAKASASSEPSTRVKEYREKLWRAIFADVVSKLDIPKNRAVLLALCVSRPSVINHNDLREAISADLKLDAQSGPGSVIRQILDADHHVLGLAIHRIAANVNSGPNGLDAKDVTGILDAFEVKIADHWKVSKAFLDLLTKNEIDAVSEEIGAKQAMGAGYAKARNLGKGEFIDAVMAAPEFDFAGRIPKLVTW